LVISINGIELASFSRVLSRYLLYAVYALPSYKRKKTPSTDSSPIWDSNLDFSSRYL
jgi:hypothetical protein